MSCDSVGFDASRLRLKNKNKNKNNNNNNNNKNKIAQGDVNIFSQLTCF